MNVTSIKEEAHCEMSVFGTEDEKEPHSFDISKDSCTINFKTLYDNLAFSDSFSYDNYNNETIVQSVPETEKKCSINPLRRKRFVCPFVNCGRNFLFSGSLKIHITLHGNTKYQCRVCNKVYFDENVKMNHYQTNHAKKIEGKTQEIEYPCQLPSCNLTFTNEFDLQDHVNNVHVNDFNSQFQCCKCPKKYESHQAYLRHVRCNHSRATKCQECGKYFHKKIEFLIHKKVHTYQKPHICKQCGMEFRSSSNLSRHINTHEGKNYFCKICFADFSYSSTLTRHIKLMHPRAWKKSIVTIPFTKSK